MDKIVDQLLQFIYTYDLGSLKELWTHLDQRMFSKLEHNFTPGIYYRVFLFPLYIDFFNCRTLTCTPKQNYCFSDSYIYVTAVRRLENAVLKFYLVNAVISGKPQKVTEFFARFTPELNSQAEWREWFSKLP